MRMLISSAIWLLDAYSLMIFICIIISWVPEWQQSKFAEILSRIVDPFLAPFRRWIPPLGGWDISAVVAITLLQLAARGLASW